MAYDTSNPFVVADAAPADRAQFYRRTYAHVAGAFTVWGVLLAGFFATGLAGPIAKVFFGMGNIGMLLVMLGLGFATTAAQTMAYSRSSKGTQYAGMGLAILAEAVLFVPLILLVVLQMPEARTNEVGAWEAAVRSVFAPALLTTGLLIAGLTASVFMSNKDFSFLRTAVVIGSFVAIGVVIAAIIFGITLGFWFAVAMVALMAGAILYQTSQIKYQASPDQYVGAATALFISFVTLLWYVIRIFMSRRD